MSFPGIEFGIILKGPGNVLVGMWIALPRMGGAV